MRREKEKQAVVPRTLMKDDFFFFSRESVYGWAGLEIPRLACDMGGCACIRSTSTN